MKKFITAALLFALVLALPALGAQAVNTGYSGYLDAETNEPLTDEQRESDSSVIGGRTNVSGDCYFDWNTHGFVYSVNNGSVEVHTTAVDGMVLRGTASISCSSEEAIKVYRNGEDYTDSLASITEPGEYVVSLTQAGTTGRLFAFTIVGETVGSLYRFTAPDGFYIISAYYEDEDVYSDRYVLGMDKEGEYSVEYECAATDIVYSFRTVVDRTPPHAELDGRTDKEGRYHSAVTFSGLAPNDSVVLTRDGERVYPTRDIDGVYTIIDSGNYVLRVYDEAGNYEEQIFVIMLYFSISSWAFFGLVLISVISVAAYVIYKRRHLRIG